MGDVRDRGLQADVHTVEVDAGDASTDVLVGTPEHQVAPVDDRHPAPQSIEHVGHLGGDEPASEDHQPFR